MPRASKYVRRYGAVEYMLSTRGRPMRTRRMRSAAAVPERLKGRVTSTFLMLKKPFLIAQSLTGVPSTGCGAGL